MRLSSIMVAFALMCGISLLAPSTAEARVSVGINFGCCQQGYVQERVYVPYERVYTPYPYYERVYTPSPRPVYQPVYVTPGYYRPPRHHGGFSVNYWR